MTPIFYIGPCSEKPYFPSWADKKEELTNQELRIAKTILNWDASDYTQFCSEEWLANKAETAKRLEHIDFFELVYILANDTDCTARLPYLWGKLGADQSTFVDNVHILKSCDNGQTWEKTEEFEPELPHTRAMAWNWILLRWTTSGKNFFFKMANNNLLPIEETTDNRGKRAEYINLDELKHVLSDSSIPLPKLLFPVTQPPINEQSKQIDTDVMDAVKNYQSVIGKKGGKKSKINEPILAASIKFISDDPKARDKSNQKIANSFCKKHNENKPMTVTIDGAKWDIYCSGDHIFSRLGEFGNKRDNNKEKSISCTTFQNTYIMKAKKHHLSDHSPIIPFISAT